jgi:hypothetical protein
MTSRNKMVERSRPAEAEIADRADSGTTLSAESLSLQQQLRRALSVRGFPAGFIDVRQWRL